MIDLKEILNKNPEVILRGEFGVVVGESLIVAPNAKNGKIVIFFDQKNQIAAVSHFDSSEKLSENLTDIFQELTELGSDVKDLSTTILEKAVQKSFIDRLQKDFKDKVVDFLQQNNNQSQPNYTSWSGNDVCNVVVNGCGKILIDQTPELMRALLNQLIFSVDGDERITSAMDSETIQKLKKIKNSATKQQIIQNIELMKKTPSSVIVKFNADKVIQKDQQIQK
jgi:hypothetical protein